MEGTVPTRPTHPLPEAALLPARCSQGAEVDRIKGNTHKPSWFGQEPLDYSGASVLSGFKFYPNGAL